MNNTKHGRSRPARHNNANRRRPSNNNNKKKQPKTIDISLLVKSANYTEAVKYTSNRTIDDLPIHHNLRNNMLSKGYKSPTEIQDRTLEPLLERRNLLGIAQTGTGKTAAFLTPIVHQLINEHQNNYALIVVPTRELALQVNEEFRSLTKGMKIYSQCFIGGVNINKDIQQLRRPAQVIIGTPGRILDLMKRRSLKLRDVNTLVLDEFDRMLDMGFVRDVERILDEMDSREQTMLFSATLDKKQQGLIDDILEEYETVKVTAGNTSTDNVDQSIVKLERNENKFEVLLDLLYNKEFDRVVLFEETKHKVKKLCQMLIKAGFKAEEIHGNKSQAARQTALNMFKKGKSNILVATDVASRGIDIDDVSHVINYQVPTSYDSYIHRIGRTGRAGKLGKAITLVDNDKWQKRDRAYA